MQSPTHIKGGILDHVLTNCESIVSSLTVSFNSPIGSDHFAVFLRLCCTPYKFPKHFCLHYYDYSRADWNGLLDYFLDYDFDICFSADDIDNVWLSLKESLLSSVDLFVPKSKKSVKSHQ